MVNNNGNNNKVFDDEYVDITGNVKVIFCGDNDSEKIELELPVDVYILIMSNGGAEYLEQLVRDDTLPRSDF